MTRLPRLYAIADGSMGDPVEMARALVASGVSLVQLRDKAAPPGRILKMAREILADESNPPDFRLIINDRPDLARIAGAHGVHVGQDDLPPHAVRQIVGSDCIVGLSTHNLVQALASEDEPVDYIAVGPVYGTRTKADASPAVGLDALEAICRRVRRPVVAIGGIDLDRAPEVLRRGAASVAVLSGLVGTPDIGLRVKAFLAQLNG